MLQAKKATELMKNRLRRRGYNLEESCNVMQKQKGNLLYLKRGSLQQSNVKELKRFL